MNLSEIIQNIYQLAPPVLGEPQERSILKDLRSLTVDLIAAYRRSGLLEVDPFEEVRFRSIFLHEKEVRSVLGKGTVLITGGSGCIGTLLIRKLIQLGARRVVSVDRVFPSETPAPAPQFGFYDCDLYDGEGLRRIFQHEKPHVVFHLGAQRNPGLAERQIRDTLRSNVVGTANVLRATHESGAAHFVYSSTGKASRYLTSEVYAASKKLAEWQTLQASQEAGTTVFSAVRFTHILDNSLVCGQIAGRIAANLPINVHAPHRYIIAQSGTEAVHLLLNSLVFSQPQKPRIAVVQNLGWPGETLEHALFALAQSRKPLPIFFQGLPSGYEESFFPGQVAWNSISQVHPLINVLEEHTRTSDSAGETILVDPAAFDGGLLEEEIEHLTAATADQSLSDADLKWANAQAVHRVAASSMKAAPVERVLQILRWGTEPQRLKNNGDTLGKHRDTIEMLGECIASRKTEALEKEVGFQMGEIDRILETVRSTGKPNSPDRFKSMAAC